MSIQSYLPNAYQPEHIRLLETIADQVATAINHARLFDKIQETTRYLALLNDITNSALMATDMHTLMQTVADKMGALLKSDSCHITLWDSTLDVPIPAAAFGPLREAFPSDKPIQGEVTLTESVLKAGHPLVVEDINHTPYIGPALAQRYAPVHSVLALPLMAAGQRLGAALIGFNDIHHFSEEEIARGAQAADQIALATSKLRLANTDPLTGLYNRRGLFEVGKREIERFHRYGSPLSVILLDIDHFKRVNDNYSHAIGDQVLMAVVEMCRKKIRAVDTLGRYGGEEFALLLPETDFEAAQLLAQRLCTSIGETPIETPHGNISITVSIGVTFINAETSGLDMLINRADDAMYAAKRAGRNRVMAFVA
jgi:diguanylate cyclase (GGDEF)-like protein